MIEIYTDGGFKRGWGSWAFVTVQNQAIIQEKCNRVRKTDSLRMEYQAAIEALQSLPSGAQATIFSDCRILLDNLKHFARWESLQWQRVPHGDLLKVLYKELQNKQIEWKWVRAHSGHSFNERCDFLCRRARGFS